MILHKFEKNEKYGYKDENEVVVIPANYEDAEEFKDNYAIVKLNGSYGVINSADESIIDFIFSSIKEQYLFFECKSLQENKLEENSIWYSREGVSLHNGKANALSEDFLCVSNGEKYGVINRNGNRVINYLYDEIVQGNELFIVLRGNKLGLYELDGSVILDTFCHSIESVEIENNAMTLGLTTFHEEIGTYYYPGYCKEYFFDPNGCRHDSNGKTRDLLYRRVISVRNVRTGYGYNEKGNPLYKINLWNSIKDITKPLIISTDEGKMIFLKSEGILPNSNFDDIQQLTQICYVVKKNNFYGVYRIDTKSLVLPLEYESIKFYGGHTVLVCKDGLWGAQSLGLETNIFNCLFKVSIPTEYSEISILDDFQYFFGGKKECSYTSYYTIINPIGQEIEEINELKCESQFIHIDGSHFMTSIGEKYGFVNTDGQKVIPFKYDEIVPREDGMFNVRIHNRYGILTLDGFEVVPIKYSSLLPNIIDKNIIVQDAESECYGVIGSSGRELIPTVYEHLFDSEDDTLYYSGYGGYEDECGVNFFSGHICRAKWGVVSVDGKQIIENKYDCLRMQSGFIVAGRDGTFFPDTDDYNSMVNCTNYGGVYDLYDKNGELLIGGFREFKYNKEKGLYIFFFGGRWKEYSAFDDDWNNIHVTGYKFDRGNDLWLILDKNFKTLLRDKNGNPRQFEKGFLGNVRIKEEDHKITHVYNMPIEFMARGFNRVAINSVIIDDNNSEYHNSQAVDIETGRTSKWYSKIEQITKSLFFFAEDDKVGITNIDSEYFVKDCLFLTLPVAGYIFVPQEKVEGVYDVYLYNIDDLKHSVALAIANIKEADLIYMVEWDWLKMEYNENEKGLKSLVIPHNRFLETTFLEMVSTKETKEVDYFSRHKNITYIFSNDYHFIPDEPNQNYDRDDHDYMRDSWDAMTDGMYGDMPDGFSGDFEFLG